MKTIAVFQHTEVGAPGSVPSILAGLGRQVHHIRVHAGEFPQMRLESLGGLVFLGGSMSAHDSLPWISEELEWIRQAEALGIPVMGHCLGSQLVALALGGRVHRMNRAEIGWRPLQTGGDEPSRQWWGDWSERQLLAFQWHQDTFVPPDGAQQIARSIDCEHQGFVVAGRHVLLQSHLEITPDLVRLSVDRNGAQLRREIAAGNPAVSPLDDTTANLEARTLASTAALRSLYTRWVQACP